MKNMIEVLQKILKEYEPLEGAEVECGTIKKETLEEAREVLYEHIQKQSRAHSGPFDDVNLLLDF